MKSLAVFAHYDVDNLIKKYVIYYLHKLSEMIDEIIFVSTSSLDKSELAKLESLNVQIIIRENVGHDFYSYKTGIEAIENINEVGQLILCNDSCFGPLFPLSDIFTRITSLKADFWGMSANSRPQFHLQSYFLVFNNKIINSDGFKFFWQELQILDSKDQIVFNYEIGLSQKLISEGFFAQSFLPVADYKISIIRLFWRKLVIYVKELTNRQSRYSWKTILEPLQRVDKTISLFDYSIENYQFPFLKKSLLNDRWVNQTQLFDLIIKHSNYDINLIKEVANE
jgi:lipopolysaccharide biosynthesis protein